MKVYLSLALFVAGWVCLVEGCSPPIGWVYEPWGLQKMLYNSPYVLLVRGRPEGRDEQHRHSASHLCTTTVRHSGLPPANLRILVGDTELMPVQSGVRARQQLHRGHREERRLPSRCLPQQSSV